jgi:transposase
MANRQHLDDVTRGRIIGRLEAGQTQLQVARDMGVTQSVISRLWNLFRTGSNVVRRYGRGRPRVTTPQQERQLSLICRRNRRQTTGQMAAALGHATGVVISRSTVSRRLHNVGLYARRPVRCVPLTPAHRRTRIQWAREHLNWSRGDWARVLFSDESRFTLQPDSGRVLIWREQGTRYHRANILEMDHYHGGGILVWGGIMLSSRTPLYPFGGRSVNATVYRDTILEPCVRLFRGAVGEEFIFMDDNARPHRAILVDEYLETEGIQRMEWPARSPDLNPIEHVWDMIGRGLAAIHPPPLTRFQLERAVVRIWDGLPQNMIDHLIDSMGRRCEACIQARGDHIPY